MKIFPAIDLRNGKCVRLTKGEFETEKIYNENPIHQAAIFNELGFKNLHIIDLDGALKGDLVNIEIIEKLIKKFNIKVEVGGGIRNEKSVSKLIDVGTDKIILGTAAIKDKFFLESCCKKFPKKIALALDVRKNKIAISGWKDQTNISVYDYLQSVKDLGISRLIYTDIERDGTNRGPNLIDSYDIAKKFNVPVVISGGISSMNDINKIISENKKIEGIIVGKAIYENKIDLRELSKI
ncbi:1-(5-phosphoribosyl)-5-[(5-phosphoribosylamino)methylideneamino]imidazole-4-carboxamide isomerase [Pelagibacteraceae bacterium]|jgi:phosphoribosylformimino-5-aminoimidazole carboxamide ribotide isomerase|nr:1-(5-phosphoribosyl)-5-[(5-phosphoribosylamino)methylideneamino]imidazole-4-carboxamide isomerase [Pelagibacteraceae bacterium]